MIDIKDIAPEDRDKFHTVMVPTREHHKEMRGKYFLGDDEYALVAVSRMDDTDPHLTSVYQVITNVSDLTDVALAWDTTEDYVERGQENPDEHNSSERYEFVTHT